MQDIPGALSTDSRIFVGATIDSRIGSAPSGENRDTDWVALALEADQTVLISLEGRGRSGLVDPLVRVRDASGTILEFNDDAGGSEDFDAGLIFTASVAGEYFIEARGGRKKDTGDYRLSVTETDRPTDPLPALDWDGERIETSDVFVNFVPRGRFLQGYDAEGFNDYEREMFDAAFDRIDDLVQIEFVETGRKGSDFRLLLDTDEIGRRGFLGQFEPPGERKAGDGVFNGKAWDREPGGDLDEGGFSYITIVHELLHGLGLAHPHDNGGASEIFDAVSGDFDDTGAFDLNQTVFTIMSYNADYQFGASGEAPDAAGLYGHATGPMALDIALLQTKYGANMETATGDDVYVLPGENAPGIGWDAIWDAGGRDTIRYDGGRDVVIDLRAATLRYEIGGGGFVSAAEGVAGGVTIAADVVIEMAHGGRGDDVLVGNDADNVLRGARGADVLEGGAGADVLIGGRGRDVFVFSGPGDNADASSTDIVREFKSGRDSLDFSAVFEEGHAQDRGVDLLGALPFSGDGSAAIRWELQGNGIVVAADIDGDGAGDVAVHLTRSDSLTADDFLL